MTTEDAAGAPGNGYAIEQMTVDDMRRMTPEAIMRAHAEGRFAQVLGSSSAHANTMPAARATQLPADGEPWTIEHLRRAWAGGWWDEITKAREAGQLDTIQWEETT